MNENAGDNSDPEVDVSEGDHVQVLVKFFKEVPGMSDSQATQLAQLTKKLGASNVNECKDFYNAHMSLGESDGGFDVVTHLTNIFKDVQEIADVPLHMCRTLAGLCCSFFRSLLESGRQPNANTVNGGTGSNNPTNTRIASCFFKTKMAPINDSASQPGPGNGPTRKQKVVPPKFEGLKKPSFKRNLLRT